MYNDRPKQKAVKNQKKHNVQSSRTLESYCSCPNNPNFKRNQSEDKYDNDEDDSKLKTQKQNEKLLRSELKKYGLKPKKSSDLKNLDKVKGGNNNSNEKNVSGNKKVKGNSRKGKTKAKTDPNLEKYVDGLKKEIRSSKGEIPSLPGKYKDKYLESLKEEVFLNKLSTHHEKRRILQNLQTEIKEYRECPCWRTEIRPDSSPFQGNITKELLTNCTSSRSSSDASKEMAKRKIHKKGTSDGLCSLCATDANRQKPMIRPVASTKDETVDCKIIARNSSPTVCGQNYMHMSPELLRNLEMIRCLIPQMSSVIQKAESGLGRKVSRAQDAPKTVQDRACSPVGKSPKWFSPTEIPKESHEIQTEERPCSKDQRKVHMVEEKATVQTETENDLQPPYIGYILENVENIKESKCLLTGFQKELSEIKEEIKECKRCNMKSVKSDTKSNYCEKHATYIPLLKVGDVGSRNDQIELINILKTEISLKNHLEHQMENIARLESELSNVRLSKNDEDIKSVEKALELTRSYFNNLLVKQETERLLNEQQDMLKRRCVPNCSESRCVKLGVQKQMHELMGQVRTSINTDLKTAKQRLKIQKMPTIDIPKSLQIQNTLNLNIPPSPPPSGGLTTNVTCETVVTKEVTQSSNIAIQTLTSVNKSSSVEMSTTDSKPKASQQTQLPVQPEVPRVVPRNLESQADNISGSDIGVEIPLKSPSELDFVRTQQTQCDSDSSLNAPKSKYPFFQESIKMNIKYPGRETTDTQTMDATDNDSNYLFGFREYLMQKSPVANLVRHGNLIDSGLQASLGSSDDSVAMKSVGMSAKLNFGEERRGSIGGAIVNNDDKVVMKTVATNTTLTFSENNRGSIGGTTVSRSSQDDKIKSISKTDFSGSKDDKIKSASKTHFSTSMDDKIKSESKMDVSTSKDNIKSISKKDLSSSKEDNIKSISKTDSSSSKDDNIKSISKTNVSSSNASFKKSLQSNIYLERPPSLKKMYLSPNGNRQDSNRQLSSKLSSSLSNQNLQRKYKLKPFSLSQIPESESEENTEVKDTSVTEVKDTSVTELEDVDTGDEDPSDGLEFYKSLTSLEELPKRRATIGIDDIPHEIQIERSREAFGSIDISTTSKSNEQFDSVLTVDGPYESAKSIGENDSDEMSDDSINKEQRTNYVMGGEYDEEGNEIICEDIPMDKEDDYSYSPEKVDSAEPESLKDEQSRKDFHIKSILIGSSTKTPHDTAKKFSLDLQKSSSDVTQQKSVVYDSDAQSIHSVELSEDTRLAILQHSFRESVNLTTIPEIKPVVNTKPITEKESKETNVSAEVNTILASESLEQDSVSIPIAEGPTAKTVLSIFPPTYRFKIDPTTTKLKKPLFDDNILLHGPIYFKSSKSFIKPEVSNDFSKDSEDFRPPIVEYHKTVKKKGSVNKVDTNRQLPSVVHSMRSDDESRRYPERPCCSSKNDDLPRFRANDKCLILSKLAKQRAEYWEKYSHEGYSTHSNRSTSEGEVKCKCSNISAGEVHSCSRGKTRVNCLKKTHTGINRKDNLSSHLVLQKERKHYQHWVTYYSNKKNADDLSTCSRHCDKKRMK